MPGNNHSYPTELQELVCWAQFKGCWVTVSDDDTIRMWDTDAVQLKCFDYNGDSGLRMYVDNVNERLLVACMDRIVRVYDLDDPHPILKYAGHSDAIRCLGYIEEYGWYVSGAWDTTLRLWLSEKRQNKFSFLSKRKGKAELTQHAPGENPEEVEEKYRSSYEKANPLTPPRTLKIGTGNLTVLRTMGLGKSRKKGAARNDMYDMMREADESPISRTGLAAKLSELENQLNPSTSEEYRY
mmetsp:Transcript_13241/g.37388  ORF Transcript_13241/g.37388 Transcript_13241/m.37388 type:complete len:240 (+) Transcript_13241:378-1097(+)|eukprot:CAMPEP_0117676256 /NCGR_PEP_ID=MMETSP0804-20121206/16061_1 /TAXON_ID=1074897 /ORGANISM="Tetraselmis astigmatica, Strain CCMP880" /LENGTH=239 /DNA_ID=CAMNT_0005485353 /DNA_START=228 /DNA_END=947 /DNA_ORIENTATION=-